MRIGIFTKVFERASLAETLDAVVAAGLHAVQFNLSCVGLPEMPDVIDPALAKHIRQECAARHIEMSAVSGTFNIIHPDRSLRDADMQRLRVLAAACHDMGTSMITLSTGTRNAQNMWHRHPENDSAAAWDDMLHAMRQIAQIGAEFDVCMAFEPEVNNVVDTALKARQLLDSLQSPYVKVVIDAANLFHTGELPMMAQILDQAFQLLGPDIVLAHAKDLSRDGDAGHEAAGQGLLDYPRYTRLLQEYGYTGPLVLHSLTEAQLPGCIHFLNSM